MEKNELEHLAQAAEELLCQLIETPRLSREEEAAADLLQQRMGEWGLTPMRCGNNVYAVSLHRTDGPTLLLNAHIDTVRAAAGWTRPPHRATREGGRIYGLGSNDDGASLVCLLQVFRWLTQREQPYNLVFAASAEEEVSGRGGIEMLLPHLPPIDLALVGEPTGMQPAIAEKGLMVVDVVARGRTGHAARDEGDNAIYHALDDIQWLRGFRFPKVSPLLGPVKTTVTIVNAGTQHNVVPAECAYTIDVRSNECYTNQEIFEYLQAHLRGEAKARSFRLNSSRIPVEHPLVRRAIALGRVPYGSPTLSDQALMPFPSLKMGPGESSRSHTADEYIETREIRDSIALYTDLLNGLSIARD